MLNYVPSKIKMANTHHRKKHKQRLQHYHHRQESVSVTKKTKNASIAFAIVGAIAGCLIGYFATEGSAVWTIIGIIPGILLGYFAGNALDKQANK